MAPADEVKERFAWMAKLDDDDAAAVALSEPRTALVDGGEYIDATSPKRGVVTSLEGETVPVGGVYIVKGEQDPALWDRLVAGIR